MLSEELPFYEKNGLLYPRVSTVLSETLRIFHPKRHSGFEWWRLHYKNAEKILETATMRGSLLHVSIRDALIDYIPGVHWQPSLQLLFDHNIFEYMHCLSPLLDEIKSENDSSTLSVEEKVFCEYGYSGSPDIRCIFRGKRTLFDWKSLRSYKEEGVRMEHKPPSKFREGMVQGCAYSLSHNIAFKRGEINFGPIEQIGIVACYDWSEPEIFFLRPETRACLTDEFIDRFAAYQELSQLTYPVREDQL